MKKITFILILSVIVCIGTLGVSSGVAFAAVSEAECDQVFVATLNELLSAENAEDTYFSASKTILHDLDLEPFGYLYSFTANSAPGFAIVINSYGEYECMEIYFDAQNPYADVEDEAHCIYVNTMVYWVYADDTYCDLLTGEEVPQGIVEAAREKAYFSSNTPFVIVPEYIYYTYKSETNYQMVNRHPYNYTSTTTSGCVPTMGANIIQFYDRYSINLIPSYDPGNLIGTIYRYKAPSASTQQVIIQLDSDMACINGGATVQMFVNGMTTYCSNRNYSITFTICMSNNQFNYNTAKSQIQSGKPIALFLDPYTIETIVENNGYDNVGHSYFTAPHAMAMFGYRDITYTLTNGQTRNDSYLQVATGNSFIDRGYCKISNSMTIDQALAINIY